MAVGMSMDFERSRWRRVAQRYASGRMRVLTAATLHTQAAMDEGVKIATRNIQVHVYDAYEPEFYQRTETLLHAVEQRQLSTGIASGAVFVSRAALNANTSGNPKKKPYDRFVEHGTGSDGPGHFPRLFWLRTIQDLRHMFFDEVAPEMLHDVARAMGPRGR